LCLAVAGLLAGLLAGCGRAPTPLGAPLGDRLFGRVEVIGGRGSALGQFNKPRSVGVDSADNLYVVDMTGRVQKFSPGGEFLLSWRMPETDLGRPKGMTMDPEGRVVVIEPHYQRVNHFGPDGALAAQWGRAGTNRGELVLPRAVAFNARGDAYVSEYTVVDRVQWFRAGTREALGTFGRTGDGDGELNRPEGLDVAPDGRVYVADSGNHRIQVFSPEGRWLASYGRPGRGLGELSYPYDVRVDREGLQYVCEFGGSRIQVFDRDHRPVAIIGGAGDRPGEFNNPWSLVLDSRGNLYVADAGNHRVQKLIRRNRPGSAGGPPAPGPATGR
jgi:DNA-binding beta-propeller fold protein YncE